MPNLLKPISFEEFEFKFEQLNKRSFKPIYPLVKLFMLDFYYAVESVYRSLDFHLGDYMFDKKSGYFYKDGIRTLEPFYNLYTDFNIFSVVFSHLRQYALTRSVTNFLSTNTGSDYWIAMFILVQIYYGAFEKLDNPRDLIMFNNADYIDACANRFICSYLGKDATSPEVAVIPDLRSNDLIEVRNNGIGLRFSLCERSEDDALEADTDGDRDITDSIRTNPRQVNIFERESGHRIVLRPVDELMPVVEWGHPAELGPIPMDITFEAVNIPMGRMNPPVPEWMV